MRITMKGFASLKYCACPKSFLLHAGYHSHVIYVFSVCTPLSLSHEMPLMIWFMCFDLCSLSMVS